MHQLPVQTGELNETDVTNSRLAFDAFSPNSWVFLVHPRGL
jgi:hypothetical protein